MEGQAATSSAIKPQDIVHVKQDASSVVSGISAADFSEDVQGLSATAAAAGMFMSPTGKSKKIKRIKKSKKTTTPAMPTTMESTSEQPTPTKSKVKVIKKLKSPNKATTLEGNATEIPETSNSTTTTSQHAPSNESPENECADNSARRSERKLIKIKSSRKSATDVDDQSTVSGCSPQKGKKKAPPTLGDHFEEQEEAQDGFMELRSDERSTRSSRSKKKNGRAESFTALKPRSVGGEERRDIKTKKERRSRSKSADRTRSRSRSADRTKGGDDDASVARSKRTGKKKSDIAAGKASAAELTAVKKENQEMLEEIEFLRQQLNEVGADGLSRVEVEQIKMDLKVALTESSEMKQELEDYEESMAEKDSLIKKLTDAVDAQLDKVEYLELKLQRAEEEFINMEDEMKEMEDVIEIMRSSSTQEKSPPRNNEHLLEQEKALEKERQRIQQWEDEVKERENELHSERRLESERRKLDLKYSSHSKDDSVSDDPAAVIEELKTKLAEAEARNSGLREENDRLKQYAEERHAKEQELQERRDEEMRVVQIGINKQLQELDDENGSLRRKIEAMNEEKTSGEDKFVQQIEDLRKENTRLRERVELASHRPNADGNAPSGEYVCELEEEIADLREKIVEHEEHSRRQKEEIALVFVENEEVKQDLKDRESELRDLEAQYSESKAVSTKKMTQKDETISFMQTEMMRIMQEKQEVDRLLREKKLTATENDLMSSNHRKGVDEEAEKAKLEAINEQLRQLDDENRTLEEKVTELQYTHSMRLKEKQAIILDLQEELNDAKWELGARKEGADYITLLKDRKDRKRELDKARKELRKAEERILDLERENGNLTNTKQDIQKEIDSLNKSVVSMDSGEYVDGLKRQIKSLKQHNSALERKVQVEAREAEEKLRLQDTKIRILEHDVEKLKNPTRAAIKSVFYNFAKKDEEIDANDRSNGIDPQGGTDGGEQSQDESQTASSSTLTKKDFATGSEEKNGHSQKRGSRIWNIFSPRRGSQKSVRASGLGSVDLASSSFAEDDNAHNDPVIAPLEPNGDVDENISDASKNTTDAKPDTPVDDGTSGDANATEEDNASVEVPDADVPVGDIPNDSKDSTATADAEAETETVEEDSPDATHHSSEDKTEEETASDEKSADDTGNEDAVDDNDNGNRDNGEEVDDDCIGDGDDDGNGADGADDGNLTTKEGENEDEPPQSANADEDGENSSDSDTG